MQIRPFQHLWPLLLLVACKAPAQPAPASQARAQHAPAEQAWAQQTVAPRKLNESELARLASLLNPVDEDDPTHTESAAALRSAWAKATPGHPRTAATLSEQDKLAIARALCESKPVTRGTSGFKCACPSYTELAGTSEMKLGPLFPGHFSGPERSEAVVALSGCETGAGSGQSYGERALVRRMPDGFRRIFHANGALGACDTILSPSGRTRLICHKLSGHMGIYSTDFVLVAFDETDGETSQQEDAIFGFTTHDTAYLRTFPSSKGPLHVAEIKRYAVVGKARYETGDERALSVEVGVRSRVDCAGGPIVCADVDTSPIDVALRFVFDGSAFHLAAESEPAFKRITARDRD